MPVGLGDGLSQSRGRTSTLRAFPGYGARRRCDRGPSVRPRADSRSSPQTQNASPLTLGTMMYGASIPTSLAHEQLSYAYDHGVVSFDTAEMYPVPQSGDTQGASERVLGAWLKKNRARIPRSDVHITTKVAGPGAMTWLRNGPTKLDGKNIALALDASLERLETDCVDLLLLHWPDRYVPMFGEELYETDLAYDSYCSFEEQLEAVASAIESGKVRSWGLSNETAYGVMRFCEAARRMGREDLKPVAIQNAYSLVCRTAESSLVEALYMEGIRLMAYSPLAMGLLGGGYSLHPVAGVWEAAGDKRLIKYRGRYAEAESRYGPKPNVAEAVEAYVRLAREHSLDPAELALRFALSHPVVETAVVGAANMQQLEALVRFASRGALDGDMLTRVDEIHRRFPNPCP